MSAAPITFTCVYDARTYLPGRTSALSHPPAHRSCVVSIAIASSSWCWRPSTITAKSGRERARASAVIGTARVSSGASSDAREASGEIEGDGSRQGRRGRGFGGGRAGPRGPAAHAALAVRRRAAAEGVQGPARGGRRGGDGVPAIEDEEARAARRGGRVHARARQQRRAQDVRGLRGAAVGDAQVRLPGAAAPHGMPQGTSRASVPISRR